MLLTVLLLLVAPSALPLSLNDPKLLDGRIHYVIGGDAYACQQPGDGGVWSISLSTTDKSDNFLESDDPPSPANIAQS